MSCLTEHVTEGILKYSIIPYAKSNNIDVKDLIQELYNYYIDKTNFVLKDKSMTEKTTDNNTKIIIKRGRPKGSKNKDKNDDDEENKVKKKRGRPKGSTKKKMVKVEENKD